MVNLWKTPGLVPSLAFKDVPRAVDWLSRTFGLRERSEARLSWPGGYQAWLELGEVLFNVPMRGSFVELYLSALVFITANLSLGIFISTLTRTQFQAMQMSFFTFLPQILLSGFMFPFAGMPVAAQYVAEIMPLTHFLRLVRGIMLRGADLTELWPSLAALGAFIAIMLAIAVSRVRKRLD